MILPKIRPDEPGTRPGDPGNGRVLVIDERTQKFNGVTYCKYSSGGRYYAMVNAKEQALHVEVWAFHNSRPPKGYVVHHDHRNPDGSFDSDENNIEWLRLMPLSEHSSYHYKHRPPFDRICAWCEQPFQTQHPGKMYCSEACCKAARRFKKRMKQQKPKPSNDATVVVVPPVENKSPDAKPISNRRERYKETRICPLCGTPFRVDKYSRTIVCSNPDCISKAMKMAIAQRKVQKNRLERNGGINLFTNNELGVRLQCLLIDGEPWFVGRDVAKVLGYKRPNDAINAHVHPEDRRLINLNDYVAENTTAKRRGNPNQLVINLAGLFSLISESELPAARALTYWLIHTVLPRLFELSRYLPSPNILPALDASEITVEPIDITPDDQ